MRRAEIVVAVKTIAGMIVPGSVNVDDQVVASRVSVHDAKPDFLSSSAPVQGHRIVDFTNEPCLMLVLKVKRTLQSRSDKRDRSKSHVIDANRLCR
jgi:hypothetical protein